MCPAPISMMTLPEKYQVLSSSSMRVARPSSAWILTLPCVRRRPLKMIIEFLPSIVVLSASMFIGRRMSRSLTWAPDSSGVIRSAIPQSQRDFLLRETLILGGYLTADVGLQFDLVVVQ